MKNEFRQNLHLEDKLSFNCVWTNNLNPTFTSVNRRGKLASQVRYTYVVEACSIHGTRELNFNSRNKLKTFINKTKGSTWTFTKSEIETTEDELLETGDESTNESS
tara:strand:+ start:9987 stop:10304 length:318 start_codon:yes stop_codon:yes gene_type:complete